MCGRFDSGPSRIAEPDQLCCLVERFADGIVERCPETGVAADSGAHEELTVAPRNEEQKIGEVYLLGQATRQSVGLQMVDSQKRLTSGPSQTLCHCRSHNEAPDPEV